jgi:hypothetical protein
MKRYTMNILKEYINRYVSISRREKCNNKLQQYKAVVDKYCATKGVVWTIRRLKLVRLHFTRYISGKPLLVSNEMIGLRGGVPASFLFLKE